MKREFKKALAVMLALCVCVGTINADALAKTTDMQQRQEPAAEARTVSGGDDTDAGKEAEGWDGVTTEAVYEAEGYKITYVLKGCWEERYQAELTIENTGDDTIKNWYLKMPCSDNIIDIWNGSISEETEEGYIIKNAVWNRDIDVGDSVSFSYVAAGSFNGFPQEYVLTDDNVSEEQDGYQIEYKLMNDWGDGYNASMSLTNLSEDAIEDWILTFCFDREITSIWNASIESREGNCYTIRNAGYNRTIEPGGTVTFGFTGTGGTPEDEPKQHVLMSYRVLRQKIDNSQIQYACSRLKLGFHGMDSAESVTENIVLPKQSGELAVEWTSSRPDLISPEGIVNRPYEQSQDVTLTARIKSGEQTGTKTFLVHVVKSKYANVDLSELADYDDLQYLSLFNIDRPYELGVYLKEDGTLDFIDGAFTDRQVESPWEALIALYEIRGIIGSESPLEELHWDHTTGTNYGTFFTFHQTYQGVPVYGRTIVVGTDAEGYTSTLHCSFVKDIDLNTEPSLTQEQVCQMAEAEHYREVRPDTLYICIENDIPHLAWHIYGINEENESYSLMIDAHDGTMLWENALMGSALVSTTLSREDMYGNLQEFPVEYGEHLGMENHYQLIDLNRNIKIYNMKGDEGDFIGTHNIIAVEKMENPEDEEWDPEAVSAFANAIQVYDYFERQFDRKGLDQQNGEIKIGIHYGNDNGGYLNNQIFLGVGGNKAPRNLAAYLDVVAHEFTHGIVAKETGLEMQKSGALGIIDEGYADIFACMVDGDWKIAYDTEYYKVPGKAGWTCLRNIASPNETGNAARKGDAYYKNYSQSGDTEYLHADGTLISHTCYLMAQESQSENLSNMDKLAGLWYLSLLMGYDKTSEFKNVRINVVAAARALRYPADDIQRIKKAFGEVGIECDQGGEIRGNNTLSGRVITNKWEQQPIGGAKVLVMWSKKAINKPVSYKCYTTGTTEDGKFYLIDLLPGEYTITVSANGYPIKTTTVNIDIINKAYTTGDIEMKETGQYETDYPSGMGRLSGRILSGITYQGVEGATIYIRRGNDAKSGPVVEKIMTKANGIYESSLLPAGYYCLEVKDERENPDIRLTTIYLNRAIYADGGQGTSRGPFIIPG